MDINICYLLLFIIIIFLILNFNCKETFNVGGQSSNCESYAINVGNNCSNVSASATIIPKNCCEALIPNEFCNWEDTNNNEYYAKELRNIGNILKHKYKICEYQNVLNSKCNEDDVYKFIDSIYNDSGIDCEIDGETVTKCGPICKNLFTQFYNKCKTEIKQMKLDEKFTNIIKECNLDSPDSPDCISEITSKYNRIFNGNKFNGNIDNCLNECKVDFNKNIYCKNYLENNPDFANLLCEQICI